MSIKIQRSRTRTSLVGRLSVFPLLALSAIPLLTSCGGGDDSSSPEATELSFRVAWEQPRSRATGPDGRAFDTPIPPSVSAIRFVFRPAAPADPCCIAVVRGSQAFIDRRILLADTPTGLGSLEVRGFPTNFAPAASGVTDVCPTRPAGQGVPCAGNPNTLASFASDETPVDVLPNTRNVVDIDVHSLPFLIDLDPEDGETVDSARPHINFTVVDAVNDIDPDVNVRLRNPPVTTEADILTSEECLDGSSELPDCSEDGELEVRGLRITSRSTDPLPPGEAELRIRASNEAEDPQDMESNTTFLVPDETTTTTLPEPETFCLKFSVSSEVDLVGISYDVGYPSGSDFAGSGENVSCFSLLETNPDNTLTTFNDDEDSGTLSSAIISTETFSGPVALAQCEYSTPPPLDLAELQIQVTEATAPDLSSTNATVVVEETPCSLD